MNEKEFFAGARILASEPVYKEVGSIVKKLDDKCRLVTTKHGRALAIANPNGEGTIYAHLDDAVPMKESYTITKLVAIRAWEERNIVVGQISLKAS